MSSGFFFSFLTLAAHFLQTCGDGALGEETPPAPELVQVSSGVSSGLSLGVVLRCLAPAGHKGKVFKLYRKYTLIDSQKFDMEHSHVDFHLKNITADTEDIYCCGYDYSAFSPYTHISAPPSPITPPQLSVLPADAQPGQIVEFYCQAPPTTTVMEFILHKQSWEGQDPQVVRRSTSPHIMVGPVDMADGGMYTCFYMLNKPEGVVNSAPSSLVSLNVGVVLPAPQLSQGGEGALVCTGSPSYPGAHFSLFQQGSLLPLATQPAHTIQHSVRFAVSGNQWEGGGYQCQYSVLLGNTWAHSQLSTSITLPCVPGSPACGPYSTDYHSPHTGSMDLPLVCGSISAALLFLMVVLILVFGIRKYAKSATTKRRQREQEQFWKQVHSRDHIIDLTLQRVSTGSKEEGGFSVSEPIYDCPLTSFHIPPVY